MINMEKTVKAIKESVEDAKVIIGGAPAPETRSGPAIHLALTATVVMPIHVDAFSLALAAEDCPLGPGPTANRVPLFTAITFIS